MKTGVEHYRRSMPVTMGCLVGIESAKPGFKHLIIQPDLQNHSSIHSTIPHHNGKIQIEATRDANNKLTAQVELPLDTHGTIIWENKKIRLRPGINRLEL